MRMYDSAQKLALQPIMDLEDWMLIDLTWGDSRGDWKTVDVN